MFLTLLAQVFFLAGDIIASLAIQGRKRLNVYSILHVYSIMLDIVVVASDFHFLVFFVKQIYTSGVALGTL